MEQFLICIAGYKIKISSQYDYVRNYCREFFGTFGTPDLCVTITQADIDRERAYNKVAEQASVPSDQYLESMALLRILTDRMLERGVILFHGAAVSINDSGIIFSGLSGIGKTTHIKKWILNLPDIVVINGDKPFIATGQVPMVCGSPWGGKEQFFTNTVAPLKSIVLLERGEENRIKKISVSQAFPRLCQQIARPTDNAKTIKTLHLLKSLAPAVSFWSFQCNNFKDDCFDVAYNALVGNDR